MFVCFNLFCRNPCVLQGIHWKLKNTEGVFCWFSVESIVFYNVCTEKTKTPSVFLVFHWLHIEIQENWRFLLFFVLIHWFCIGFVRFWANSLVLYQVLRKIVGVWLCPGQIHWLSLPNWLRSESTGLPDLMKMY